MGRICTEIKAAHDVPFPEQQVQPIGLLDACPVGTGVAAWVIVFE